MKIHFLESGFAVADTVKPADMARIKEQGFGAVICHRREGEDDYEGALVYARAAESQGLEWVSIPVPSGEYSKADVDAFSEALENSASPVLGFCRTGRRAVHMWAQSKARDPLCSITMLIDAAQAAGHDPQLVKEILES